MFLRAAGVLGSSFSALEFEGLEFMGGNSIHSIIFFLSEDVCVFFSGFWLQDDEGSMTRT